jgi:hypothetical protein
MLNIMQRSILLPRGRRQRLTKYVEAELGRAKPRQGEPQYAAIRQAAIRRAAMLGTRRIAGQTAGIDPRRKIVATRFNVGIRRTLNGCLSSPSIDLNIVE